MKQRLKKIMFIFFLFIIGVLIGAVGSVAYSIMHFRYRQEMVAQNYLVFEYKEAYKEYLYTADINTSIYALKHFINVLEHFIKKINNFYDVKYFWPKELYKLLSYTLVTSYVRLGNLYKRKGEDEKAMENYKKGLEIAQKKNLFKEWEATEKEIKTIDDLIRYVDKLDEKLKKNKNR